MTTTQTSKMIETIEYKAQDIAEQWYKNVKINPKTPIFHNMPQERGHRSGSEFPQQLQETFQYG